MSPFTEKIYFNSPIFLQNVMIYVYGYKLYRERYAGNHNLHLDELLKSQWLNASELKRLSNERFLLVFEQAIRHVPYYRSLVKSGRIDPNTIKDTEHICSLPILYKEQLRTESDLLIDETVEKRNIITINTSGTSGKTLKIAVDKDSRRLAYAFFSRFKTWAGIKGPVKSITLAGRPIVHPDADKPPFWRKNMVMNNYLFSSYHLSERNLRSYIDKLRQIQPHFIDSYPSSIYTIALYMKERGVDGVNPKAIITSSETLLDHQRAVIEDVFRCKVFDQYGSAEQVVFISQCEKGTYHVHPEFGIVEIIKDDGRRAKPGEAGRLVCTGFTNRAMPLIRYDIGDTGIMSDKKCSCGRNFPVIEKIVGRTDDIITTRDGRQVGRLDPVFKGLQTIKEAQIVQEDYDSIVLRMVPGIEFKKNDADVVVHELKKRLGSQMKVNVEIVSEIQRTSAGKFRAVISKVKRA